MNGLLFLHPLEQLVSRECMNNETAGKNIIRSWQSKALPEGECFATLHVSAGIYFFEFFIKLTLRKNHAENIPHFRAWR
jgi:hypothetical protein